MRQAQAVALAQVRGPARELYLHAEDRVKALENYDTAVAPLWKAYMDALGQVEKAHPELRDVRGGGFKRGKGTHFRGRKAVREALGEKGERKNADNAIT